MFLGQIAVDPVRGLILNLESGDLRDQLFAQRRRSFRIQYGARRGGQLRRADLNCRSAAFCWRGVGPLLSCDVCRLQLSEPSAAGGSNFGATSTFALRSGASRSSSPAIPTRVKRA